MGATRKKYAIPRDYEILGQFLRDQRLRADLTQRQVSDALGYSSAQFISNFERGIASPPLDKLKILSRLYKMPVEQVVDLVISAERSIMAKVLRG